MKRFVAIALLLALCFCLFSCDEDIVPDGMKPASDTDIVDYKLYVPEEWIVSEAGRATTQAFASEGDRTNILVMQWNITDNTKTVADWWEKEYKPQVFTTGAVQDHKILSEGEEMLLDSKPAYRYVYTGKIGDSYFKYDVIACVTQGSIYVIQLTYMQDAVKEGEEITFKTEEKHKESVKKIIDNFKFE
ncbi:MAG: hypothetical protein E7596_01875 [Ruminococcaceae bacterium]|nr:hypothetical protein [Oscillospiraceae bacterium]